MGQRAALATILLFLIVADVASAWNFRKLGASAPKEKSHGAVSPSSSPSPSPAPSSGHEDHKDKLSNKAPPPEPAKKGKEGEKKKDETKGKAPSPVPVKKDKEGEKKKDETKGKAPSPVPVKKDKEGEKKKKEGESNEVCDVGKLFCKDTMSLVACVQAVDEVNKDMVVLIQNDGESDLKVNIRTSSLKKLKDEIQVPKHHSKRTHISLNDTGTQIVLNAGSGDCTLQLGVPVSKADLPDWFPSSYNDLMTPVYGAYLLILVTIVALGVFACCKCRSRTQDEIPYQELEMGETRETTTTTSTSVNVEVADGWDQGWDDDWDDDTAIKSPGTRRSEIVPANGHSSKSPNGDGWEDWDD